MVLTKPAAAEFGGGGLYRLGKFRPVKTTGISANQLLAVGRIHQCLPLRMLSAIGGKPIQQVTGTPPALAGVFLNNFRLVQNHDVLQRRSRMSPPRYWP